MAVFLASIVFFIADVFLHNVLLAAVTLDGGEGVLDFMYSRSSYDHRFSNPYSAGTQSTSGGFNSQEDIAGTTQAKHREVFGDADEW